VIQMLRFDVLDRTATAGLILAAVASALCLPARAIDGWSDQPQAAFEAARDGGRPILVLFTGSDWCPHCRLLEEHVLATDAFKAWAGDRVDLLVIDMPRQGITAAVREERSAVCKRYGVKSFPTVMLIAPDGTKIAAQPGYSRQPADAWIASIDRKLAGWSATATAAAAETTAVAATDDRVQEVVREAVKEAEGAKRPILLVVSRASDQDGRIRAAKLVNDPEFKSFAKDTFVVAEIAAHDDTDTDTDADPAPPTTEPLRSLLGGVSLPTDEVELIVTYDGRTPMYTQSARQPTPRLISGLRRFLGARPTVRR